MRTVEPHKKLFVCDVCSESTANARTIGLEWNGDATLPIRLCHYCGLIDIELMLVCREITVGCGEN